MRCYIFYDPYLIKHNNLRQKCESLQPETETPGKLPCGPSGLDNAGKNKGSWEQHFEVREIIAHWIISLKDIRTKGYLLCSMVSWISSGTQWKQSKKWRKVSSKCCKLKCSTWRGPCISCRTLSDKSPGSCTKVLAKNKGEIMHLPMQFLDFLILYIKMQMADKCSISAMNLNMFIFY